MSGIELSTPVPALEVQFPDALLPIEMAAIARGMRGEKGDPGGIGAAIAFAFGDVANRLIVPILDRSAVIGVEVHIETPFNGAAPSLSIGTAAQPSLLASAQQTDLTAPASFDLSPNVTLEAGNDVYLSLNAGFGATQGAGWIVLQQVPRP